MTVAGHNWRHQLHPAAIAYLELDSWGVDGQVFEQIGGEVVLACLFAWFQLFECKLKFGDGEGASRCCRGEPCGRKVSL